MEHLEMTKYDESSLLSTDGNECTQGSEVGPRAELELWRARLSALTRITEQLKGRDCRIAIGVAGAARCKAYKAWRDSEAKVGLHL